MSQTAEAGMAGADRLVGELMRTGDVNGQISDLQWGYIYNQLGFLAEFQSFSASREWRPSSIDWSVPMVQGVKLPHVMELHQKKFGDLRYQSGMLSMMEHDRDATKRGSYQANFRRIFEPDPDLVPHRTIQEVVRSGVVGCTITEYALLNVALRLTKDVKLDSKGTVTVCSGSSVNGIAVVTAEFDGRATFLGTRSLDSSHADYRVREVNIPILL